MKIHTGVFAVAALAGAPALAGVATQSFTRQIALLAEATFGSVTAAINFAGSSGVISADVDSQTSLTVQGTNSTTYSIGIDQGAGVGATIAARKMSNDGATITYSLHQDPARTLLWGTTGSRLVSETANGNVQSDTIYGRVTAQPTPAPGVYTDTLTVTLIY
jgi:spore coat protein U-like protein